MVTFGKGEGKTKKWEETEQYLDIFISLEGEKGTVRENWSKFHAGDGL